MLDPPSVAPPFEWRHDGDVLWLEAATAAARIAFTTRHGGVSEGRYGSLNLGWLNGDDRRRVFKNRRRLAQVMGLKPEQIATGWQVHSAGIRSWGVPPPDAPFDGGTGFLDRVDGHLSSLPDLALLVLVADCAPLALVGPDAFAMLHCGWRGTAAGIVEHGLFAVCERSGPRAEVALGRVTAIVGPAIGPCCYTVGDEVAELFAARGHDDAISRAGNLDLPLVIMRELVQLGVDPARIHASGLCTHCQSDLYFSHRRDGAQSGRQAGMIWRQ